VYAVHDRNTLTGCRIAKFFFPVFWVWTAFLRTFEIHQNWQLSTALHIQFTAFFHKTDVKGFPAVTHAFVDKKLYPKNVQEVGKSVILW
jgi:hypothetical protein